MGLETFFSWIKYLLGLIFFPYFVLSAIFLTIAFKPWDDLWPKHKILYILLAPFVVIPYVFNACLFHLWESAFS